MFLSEKEIFDTRFDTKKYFVTMRSRFSLRSEKNKDGKSLLYLDISDKFTRPRLKTNIYMKQSSKIEYIYNFQVPKKYKDNEQITLNRYWLKIKVGDKVGYIFDKLCLTYKPYLAVKTS